jgi:decaprenylphospho-beta-D-erythro-pentofuranosid-2-ulose 2-reductase
MGRSGFFFQLCAKGGIDFMKQVLVLGATSAIAQALCRRLASQGASFRLLGRNATRLKIVADDLLTRGAGSVEFRVLRSGFYSDMQEAVEAPRPNKADLDLFLVAQGSLPEHERCERDPELLRSVLDINLTEVMEATLLVASLLEQQGKGTCVILGSVAGDRGRRSNYIYGSSKAALETFTEGLRQRLPSPCQVLLVKPGPVDTPMTAHLKKTLLFTSPERVASDIVRALKHRQPVVYSPGYWRWIMRIIRILPRSMVKRLRA